MKQHCSRGQVFLSKEFFQENLPYRENPGEGLCAPCKSNREVEVLSSEDAPEFLKDKVDWLEYPYTNDYDPFYGILWAKDFGGELYNLGACRDQTSWKKNRKCDILAAQMGLAPFEKKSWTFFGMRKPAQTMPLTKSNSTYFHATHKFLTIPDFDKEPNKYYMKSEAAPCFKDEEDVLQCGFEGSYYKIIDADGRRTPYYQEYLEHTKDMLYFYEKEQDLPPISKLTDGRFFKFISTIVIASIGLLVYKIYDHFEQGKPVNSEDDKCGARPWLYYGFLIFLLIFMFNDTYPLCAESFPPTCCPFKNDYGTSIFSILPYLFLYLPTPLLMIAAFSKGWKFGCCSCKESHEEDFEGTEELVLWNDAHALHATRWIWNPMAIIIVIAHLGMIAMRVSNGYLIGTPYKTVICTIAQIWTLLWIQHTIGSEKIQKLPFVKNFYLFAYFIMAVMAARVVIFTTASNPGATYFGLNDSCMPFNFPATAGLMIFFLAAAYGLMTTWLANPLVSFGRCNACYWFCAIPLTLALLSGVLLSQAASIIHDELNFCHSKGCDDITISKIGLSSSLMFTALNYKSRISHEAGTPSPDAILPPHHVGSKIKYPVRQATTGMYASPVDEDSKNSYSFSMSIEALFEFVNGLDFTDMDRDFSPAQKRAWFEKYDTHDLIPGWNYNLTTSDEDMGQWAFAGLAAHRLAPVGEEEAEKLAAENMRKPQFKVDVSMLEKFEVRDNYVRLGGCAYFTRDTEITGIIYRDVMYLPGEDDWEWIKFLWRSSVFLIVTGLDHLVGDHMLVSGRTTLATEENLNITHPLRLFLKPHTHGSQSVNWNAVHALFPKNGLLHRATPFTDKGFDDLIHLSSGWVKEHAFISATRDKHFTEYLKAQTDQYSYGEDQDAYIAIVREYCTTFVNTYYASEEALINDREFEIWWHQSNMHELTIPEITKENLIGHLTYYIFAVTGFHQHVGVLNQILKNPDIATWKVRKNVVGPSIQGAVQVMTIALATGDPQVLLLSYDPIRILQYDDPHRQTMLNAWAVFKRKMEKLNDEIEERNASKERKFACQSFLPKRQGISIAI